MKFLYRHRIAFAFFCTLLATVFCGAVCLFAISGTAARTQRLTVVVDAGHGGIDGGVTGIGTGIRESDVNLSVSRLLQEKLEEAGFYVVMTRKTEAGLYGAATAGYKKRDMRKRKEIILKSAPSLVISVHQNFFPTGSSRRGAQVFYRNGSEGSRALAQSIQQSLNDMEECVKKSEPLLGDYYILNCSDYPSVIAECGFLSNREDEALLSDKGYQERLAEAILRGAVRFLASEASE